MATLDHCREWNALRDDGKQYSPDMLVVTFMALSLALMLLPDWTTCFVDMKNLLPWFAGTLRYSQYHGRMKMCQRKISGRLSQKASSNHLIPVLRQ